MKKYLIFFLLQIPFLFGYSQRKYSLGVDAVLFHSLTNKQVKKDLFSEDFGLQIGFRKKLLTTTFFL